MVLFFTCFYGASRPAIDGSKKQQILKELSRLGVSKNTAQTIIMDLPEKAAVSIFGFMVGPNNPYVAIFEKESHSPSSEIPYKIRLAKNLAGSGD